MGRDLRNDPDVGGFALAFTDADSRVRAEAELAASERRHRALVRGGHERLLLTDAGGSITWVSDPSPEAPAHWRGRGYEGGTMGSALDADTAGEFEGLELTRAR